MKRRVPSIGRADQTIENQQPTAVAVDRPGLADDRTNTPRQQRLVKPILTGGQLAAPTPGIVRDAAAHCRDCPVVEVRVAPRRPRPDGAEAPPVTSTTEPLHKACPATAALPCDPSSARAARRLVRDTLTTWQLTCLRDDAEVIVTELVSNAAKTGCRRRIVVAVCRATEEIVRVSVRDGSRTLPVLVPAGPERTSGRGLALVHELTGGRWGATPDLFGKTVHADLHTSRPVS